jgi:hypothetical protein
MGHKSKRPTEEPIAVCDYERSLGEHEIQGRIHDRFRLEETKKSKATEANQHPKNKNPYLKPNK